jgi:hypothetical protein
LYAAGGFRFVALNVGATIINFGSLALLLVIIGRHATRSLIVWVAIALGVYVFRQTPMMVSAWNPHVLVLPLAALIVVSAAVASGRLPLAPAAIVLGSFCAQTHVGVAAAVIALWAFAWLAVANHVRLGEVRAEAARRWLNIAVWTAAACCSCRSRRN